MRAVITVAGKDRVGIIAEVTQALAHQNVNVLDITQTILSDMFTMIMLVEIGQDSEYNVVREALLTLAGEMNLEIRVQRSEIFEAMHQV